MLEAAKIFGVAGERLWFYAIGVLAHLQSAGAHSFHEIAISIGIWGIGLLLFTLLAKMAIPIQCRFLLHSQGEGDACDLPGPAGGTEK